jgi:hypothetical protein
MEQLKITNTRDIFIISGWMQGDPGRRDEFPQAYYQKIRT